LVKQTVLWFGLASLLQAQSVLTTFAGTDWVFPGDGKPALNVPIGDLSGITLDPDGNPCDRGQQRLHGRASAGRRQIQSARWERILPAHVS
jgi:hypothetical protein